MKKGRKDPTGTVRKTVANIVVGKPDVEPEAPSHVRGVSEGNQPKRRDERRRSTGIRPDGHEPIDPRMPKIGPA